MNSILMRLKVLLMNTKRYERIMQLVDEAAFLKVGKSKLIVFGVGGVGGQALESLVRAGFRTITIVDRDVVEESNLNRQLIATSKNLGEPKVEAAKARMLEIDLDCAIEPLYTAVSAQNINEFNLEKYDFVIDAIDDFPAKMALIKYCIINKIPLISAMGAGNRFDPTKVFITDISKTSGDPLAKKVRLELAKEQLKGLTVVTSSELPSPNKGFKPGSTSFVPPAAGLAIASYIFKKIIEK